MKYQDRFSPSSVADRGFKGNKIADLPNLPYYKPSFTSNNSGTRSPNHITDGTSSPPYENYAATRLGGGVINNLPSNTTAELRLGATAFNNGPNKCRQLPCRTFICTGSCPYSERCGKHGLFSIFAACLLTSFFL